MIEVRSPGRVNLIGEHTDYSLLPVMPMAIDRAIEITAELRHDRHLRLSAERFPHSNVTCGMSELDRVTGWAGYVIAALKVVGAPEQGMTMHVGGDLPTTGGLSSSSALTVGVLAAVDHLRKLELGPVRYPRLAQLAERSMSIEGGSMDQTVISLAVAGDALRIDFDPPRVTPVPIPAALEFVAASSGDVAAKAGAARDHYNARVVACRVAALLLGVETDVDFGDSPVLGRVAGFDDIDDRIDALPEEITAVEAAGRTGRDVGILTRLVAGSFDPTIPLPAKIVARHVLSEALRVDQAEFALRRGDVVDFGRLLDVSHKSLQAFGASVPALDRLVSSMRAAGAYGARLTGAGFGGYAIAAVPPDCIDRVIESAEMATGGPAFRVLPSDGVSVR